MVSHETSRRSMNDEQAMRVKSGVWNVSYFRDQPMMLQIFNARRALDTFTRYSQRAHHPFWIRDTSNTTNRV